MLTANQSSGAGDRSEQQELPAPPCSPAATPVSAAAWSLEPATVSGLRKWVASVCFYSFYMQVLTLGAPAVTGLLILMKFSTATIALLTSLAPLGLLAQLFSFVITNRVVRKKHFVVLCNFAEVASKVGLIFVPLLLSRENILLGAALGFIVLNNIVMGLGSPLTETWLAGLVPDATRGRVLGRIALLVNIVYIIAGLATGWLLDVVQGLPGFLIVFLFSGLMGTLTWIIRSRVPFPNAGNVHTANILDVLLMTFKNKAFCRCIIFYTIWAFASGIYFPFLNLYFLNELKLSYKTIAILTNMEFALEILVMALWGRLIDRFGAKTSIIATVPAAGVIGPLLLIASPSHPLIIVGIVMLIRGLSIPGLGIGIQTLRFQLLPEGSDRPGYLASASIYVALGALLGGLTGSFLTRWLETVRWHTPIAELGMFEIIFLLSAIMSIIPLLLAFGLTDPKSVGLPRLWARIKSTV